MKAGTFIVSLLMLVTTLVVSARQDAPVANYQIGPRDVLVVTLVGEPDWTGTYTVDADGKFSFRDLGRVQAGGLTLAQLESALRAKLMPDFFVNPQVSVTLDRSGKEVVVIGAVARPGSQPLAPGMTLLKALANAGGVSEDAAGDVLVTHGRTSAKTGPSAAGAPGTDGEDDPGASERIDLKKLQSGDLSLDVGIRNGDTVFVLQAQYAYVDGEVGKIGRYPVEKGMTLQQLLSLAGGVTQDAAAGKISIERNGKTLKNVKLSEPIMPGDSVKVPQRFF